MLAGMPFQEDKPVERDGRAPHLLARLDAHHRGHAEAQHARQQGARENPVEREEVVQEQAHHRADAHGRVVGQTVVAQTLAAARGRHDVDDHRVAPDRDGAEGQAVDDAQQDEERQRAADDVARKDGGEHEVRQQVQRLARKGVEQVARERAYQQGRHGVAAQDDADDALLAGEVFLQVEGEHGHQQPEPEVKQKVGREHTEVARRGKAGLS